MERRPVHGGLGFCRRSSNREVAVATTVLRDKSVTKGSSAFLDNVCAQRLHAARSADGERPEAVWPAARTMGDLPCGRANSSVPSPHPTASNNPRRRTLRPADRQRRPQPFPAHLACELVDAALQSATPPFMLAGSPEAGQHGLGCVERNRNCAIETATAGRCGPAAGPLRPLPRFQPAPCLARPAAHRRVHQVGRRPGLHQLGPSERRELVASPIICRQRHDRAGRCTRRPCGRTGADCINAPSQPPGILSAIRPPGRPLGWYCAIRTLCHIGRELVEIICGNVMTAGRCTRTCGRTGADCINAFSLRIAIQAGESDSDDAGTGVGHIS